MKITVLDSNTLGKDLDLSPLKKVGDVTIYGFTAPENVAERLNDCDVCIVNKIKLSKNNLAGAKNLKLICVTATGFDNIDVKYCKSASIAVCNVVGYSTHSVAQLTLAMALSLMTHLAEYRGYVNSGQYQQGDSANCVEPTFHQLCGKTWGVVGLGNIGRQVAKVARAMGCKVICCKRTPDDEFETVDIDTLMTQSDIISVHTPLNDSTKNLIGKEQIDKMKKTAILINVARGAVVDEAALCQAVLEEKIGGIGIDVYSTEPLPQNHPYTQLLGKPNVCLTPHMAWASYEARVLCIEEILENIQAFFDGNIRNRIDI